MNRFLEIGAAQDRIYFRGMLTRDAAQIFVGKIGQTAREFARRILDHNQRARLKTAFDL